MMKIPKRLKLLAGSAFAVVTATITSFIPQWIAVECGSWECRFPKKNLWAAIASFFESHNQPEAQSTILFVLLPEILVFLAIIAFSFLIGFFVARFIAKPEHLA